MTQMTLMTLNPGYGIGISSKQRHKRHLRHYRHRKKCAGGLGQKSRGQRGVRYRHRKKCAGGLGDTPRNAFVDIQTLC